MAYQKKGTLASLSASNQNSNPYGSLNKQTASFPGIMTNPPDSSLIQPTSFFEAPTMAPASSFPTMQAKNVQPATEAYETPKSTLNFSAPETEIPDNRPKYAGTDISQYTEGARGLIDTVGDQYQALLRGEDPLAEQNRNMVTTALDRMQSQTDQQTAREAAQLGVEPGSEMYNQLMEKNRETLVSQGSGVLSNLAAQNMAQKERILTQGANFAKGQQQFGLDFGKTIENINRYGFEAGIADDKQKSQYAEYIMNNPDIFSTAQVGEAKANYFGNIGIDISQLPTDPTMAEQAKSEIADSLRVAHPEWNTEQIEEESVRLFGIFSPYTSGLYEKGYNDEMGLTEGGDIEDSEEDSEFADIGGFESEMDWGIDDFEPIPGVNLPSASSAGGGPTPGFPTSAPNVPTQSGNDDDSDVIDDAMKFIMELF